MTSNGTPAKPNCAQGLRAGRNEIPVTQAPNINTRWAGGRAGCLVGGGGYVLGAHLCSAMSQRVPEWIWPIWRGSFTSTIDMNEPLRKD